MISTTAPTRPALRYHGGKFRLASWVASHFPPHRIYVEPFGGAASVLLAKPRSYAEVYNDLDGAVVVFFRVLRDPDQARELERRLRLTPFAREEFEATYADPWPDDPVERARYLLIRSYMGFGSSGLRSRRTGFRANCFRLGTIPAHDWASYPDALSMITARLQGVVIEQRPAVEVIAAADSPDTLYYVDPPYPHSTRAPSGYEMHRYQHEMTDADHAAVAEQLHQVVGMVVVSGYPCALYEEIYAGWRRVDKATFADGARARTECLWLSPATERAQGRLL